MGVALKEALSPEFKVYQKQVLDNAKALCKALQSKGFTVVSGILRSSFHIHIVFDCMYGDYLFFHYYNHHITINWPIVATRQPGVSEDRTHGLTVASPAR